MENITHLISTVGFPIVMCLLMWYDKRTTLAQNAKAIDELKEVIDRNTEVTQSLQNLIVSRETFKE